MKFNIEKAVELFVNVLAIGVGVLLIGTVGIFMYAIIRTVLGF